MREDALSGRFILKPKSGLSAASFRENLIAA